MSDAGTTTAWGPGNPDYDARKADLDRRAGLQRNPDGSYSPPTTAAPRAPAAAAAQGGPDNPFMLAGLPAGYDAKLQQLMQQAQDLLVSWLNSQGTASPNSAQLSAAVMGTVKDLLARAGYSVPDDFVRNTAREVLHRTRQVDQRVPDETKTDPLVNGGMDVPKVAQSSLLVNTPASAAKPGIASGSPGAANPVAAGGVTPTEGAWQDQYADSAISKDPYVARALDPANRQGIQNYGLSVPVESTDYQEHAYGDTRLTPFEVNFYGFDWAKANYDPDRAPGKIEPLTNFWWGTYPQGGVPGSVNDPNQWMPNPYSDPYMDPVLPSSEWVPATAKTNLSDVLKAIHDAGPSGMSDSQFQALARQLWDAGYFDAAQGEVDPYDLDHPDPPPRFDRNDMRITRGVQRLASEVDAINQTGGNATFLGLLGTRKGEWQTHWQQALNDRAEAKRKAEEANRKRPFSQRFQRPELHPEELTKAADALAQQMLGRDATPEEAAAIAGTINTIWHGQYDAQAAKDAAAGNTRDTELGAPDYSDPNSLAYDTYKKTHTGEMTEHNLLSGFDALRRLVGGT